MIRINIQRTHSQRVGQSGLGVNARLGMVARVSQLVVIKSVRSLEMVGCGRRWLVIDAEISKRFFNIDLVTGKLFGARFTA